MSGPHHEFVCDQCGKLKRPATVVMTSDPHQQALYRLAAASDYLRQTMNGGPGSTRDRPDPLPLLAMQRVRAAQSALADAIRLGARVRRETLCGQIELHEKVREETCRCLSPFSVKDGGNE